VENTDSSDQKTLGVTHSSDFNTRLTWRPNWKYPLLANMKYTYIGWSRNLPSSPEKPPHTHRFCERATLTFNSIQQCSPHWSVWPGGAPGQKLFVISHPAKKRPPVQIKAKGLCNGFSIRAPGGQNLVPTQPPKSGILRLSKTWVCHPAQKLSGGEHCTVTPPPKWSNWC
jgi:hypothetical protein